MRGKKDIFLDSRVSLKPQTGAFALVRLPSIPILTVSCFGERHTLMRFWHKFDRNDTTFNCAFTLFQGDGIYQLGSELSQGMCTVHYTGTGRFSWIFCIPCEAICPIQSKLLLGSIAYDKYPFILCSPSPFLTNTFLVLPHCSLWQSELVDPAWLWETWGTK